MSETLERGAAVRSDHEDDYYDLGTYHREVDTASAAAQRWFDRGMVWAFGFNHDEAVRCFERALEHDPTLAAARWGIAYAAGPNYNRTWASYHGPGRAAALHRARHELTIAAEQGTAHPIDRDLIATLALRYRTANSNDLDALTADHAAYADAMADLATRHPHDVDVQMLAAEALVNLTVWALWDTRTGEPAEGSRVVEARTLLERALATPEGRAHPGVLHVYLHAMEMSDEPERALYAADLLRDLVPDSGHLQHMPSHIDVLCGDYANALRANLAAVRADRKFFARSKAATPYYRYRAHNLHFAVYAAMFAGRFREAMAAADEAVEVFPAELLAVEAPPMADWLEAFVALRIHVLIRFGRWADLAEEPLPADPELYAVTTATTLYGRALALAALGRVDDADAARSAFRQAYDQVPPSRTLFKISCREALNIGARMLDGEIAYRRGDHDEAFTLLREAVDLDDSLPFDEPWGWMQPTRHALGALLLEQGHVDEAARVYAADLGLTDAVSRPCRHPRNLWSLHGYAECLRRLGRDAEAAIIGQQLAFAAARADVPVRASCACRMEAEQTCCG
ncbi:hypothetical protein [Mycolicibacterium grossiae]|uniref:hypothetical protein n=1 Tax=Mycolicibacterium grossiae TaxID=1552759 RepID=UPI000A653ED6|nr:hypothetical protein [Mycolicibacterium grossiae]